MRFQIIFMDKEPPDHEPITTFDTLEQLMDYIGKYAGQQSGWGSLEYLFVWSRRFRYAHRIQLMKCEDIAELVGTLMCLSGLVLSVIVWWSWWSSL